MKRADQRSASAAGRRPARRRPPITMAMPARYSCRRADVAAEQLLERIELHEVRSIALAILPEIPVRQPGETSADTGFRTLEEHTRAVADGTASTPLIARC